MVLFDATILTGQLGFPIVIAKFWGLRNDPVILSTESFPADTLPGLSRGYRAACQCHIAVARRT
jgi:hypothetical protein